MGCACSLKVVLLALKRLEQKNRKGLKFSICLLHEGSLKITLMTETSAAKKINALVLKQMPA